MGQAGTWQEDSAEAATERQVHHETSNEETVACNLPKGRINLLESINLSVSMSRSLKKGPYIDERVLQKVRNRKPGDSSPIKTWSRACVITPEMIGVTFGVHNGKEFPQVYVTEDMVGHRLGEFSSTRKFSRHGGKMQKEIEAASKQKESGAVAASSGGKKK